MNKLFLTLLVLGTTLVPNIVLSNNGTCTNSGTGTNSCTDTKLELVPKKVPMVPKVPKGPLDASKLVKGAHYLSIDCDLPEDMLDRVKHTHRMVPMWWGNSHNNHTFLFHRNERTGNWGLFIAFKSGPVCLASTGLREEFVVKNGGVLH